MRYLLLALLFPAAAAAFDGPASIAAYDEFRPACRQAELNGVAISQAESGNYCVAIEAIASELQANGYCWDKSEQVWAICK